MQKIPTVFVRDEATNRKYVKDEVTPGCEWVVAGEGTATRKYDGTCVMFDGSDWWARREFKAPKTAPRGFVEVEHDPVTGKTVGWVPAADSSFSRFLDEAIEPWDSFKPGTYELCGPKINGNPEEYPNHVVVPHGAVICEWAPRDFDSLRDYLGLHTFEGIVWHHPDGRMAKLKKRDFARSGSSPEKKGN